MKYGFLTIIVFLTSLITAQTLLSPLTIEKIMRDPRWIGTSPSNIRWSPDNKFIYFNWNPNGYLFDSLHRYNRELKSIEKVHDSKRVDLVTEEERVYNADRSAWTYLKNNDIFYQSSTTSEPLRITRTTARESNPHFSFHGQKIAYVLEDNLYAWAIDQGNTTQLTAFVKSAPPADTRKDSRQESWLKKDQLNEFDILNERKLKRDMQDSANKLQQKSQEIKPVYLDDKVISGIQCSPDGRFITYRLTKINRSKSTIVPSYVTESGFTEDLPARTKVGTPGSLQELMCLDKLRDTQYIISVKQLSGIKEIPAFINDYPQLFKSYTKDSADRLVTYTLLSYSPAGTHAAIDIRSQDNKDRWICLVDLPTGILKILDRQHDDAWIGGPGVGGGFGGGNSGWLNEDEYWFQSEETGYSQVYKINVVNGNKKALTRGKYEVQRTSLSVNKLHFYLSTNETHPGEQQYFKMPVSGGPVVRLTPMTGAHTVALSPDETQLAYLYSYSNKPWELYLQENKEGAVPVKITDKAMTAEFSSYPWRDPELITFHARDSAVVYARIYKPTKKLNNKAAVIFVHGAGYLQNAHRWWSSYFREFMFHNLLTDQGYTVLDMDYRGSAGYGRDWRTGIYRFMGGKDLTDHVDAAKYLAEHHGVNPKKIGIYGGSYGGFITLMGLFTAPYVFAAGAALRPVTDWAQYNHGYTSNILNEPFTDSIAYRKSSPYYYADGLKKPLLICHGMIDVNVHYQDAVKLAQRLIELRKENWELASYPMEDHGFVEPTSWMDEYKRILKLFDRWLK